MKIAPFQIDSYIQKIADEKIVGCLLFGPELALSSYRFDMIAKQICPDLSDPFLVSTINKERLSEDKSLIASEFYSISMLGGRKLILVKECDATVIASIKDLFSNADFATKSDNFILILGGDLDKSSAIRKLCEDSPHFAAIACYEDDDKTIKKFIENELIKNQIKFDFKLLDFLLEKFGKNRQIAKSEIERIVTFLGEKKELTFEVASNITASQAEISANELVTSFASQNFELALKQSQLLFKDGFEAITLIRFLTNYLQKLYQAKIEITNNSLDFEEAVKSQRLFFKTEIEFRKHLKNLSLDFLIKILQELQNLEIKIKTTSLPSKLIFTNFITSLKQ